MIIQVGVEANRLIFGRKQELRLKRLEKFLDDISLEVEAIKDRIVCIEKYDEHDKEALSAILEELTERVEYEQFGEKQEYFKIYFKKMLISPVSRNNYDERRFFLDVLGSISLLQIRILRMLFGRRTWIKLGDISIGGIESNTVAAAAIRLVYLGLAVSKGASVQYRDPEELVNQAIRLNSFGDSFCEFCLTEL